MHIIVNNENLGNDEIDFAMCINRKIIQSETLDTLIFAIVLYRLF